MNMIFIEIGIVFTSVRNSLVLNTGYETANQVQRERENLSLVWNSFILLQTNSRVCADVLEILFVAQRFDCVRDVRCIRVNTH